MIFMRDAARTALKVGAPIVAVGTLMLGLRIGAGDAVRAAVVFGAPIARTAPGEKPRVAWQVLTFLDDRGVRETVPVKALRVVGRTRRDAAEWRGSSNVDGVAEPVLAFESLAPGEPLTIEVWDESDPKPLASGEARWEAPKWGAASTGDAGGFLRPTSRSGDLGLDVAIESGRLATGFPSTIWVRVTPPAGGVAIDATPEPGLRIDEPHATMCDSGWAALEVVPEAHVVGATIEATHDKTKGKWFGVLPVAPGAFQIAAPRTLEAGKPSVAMLYAPNPRNVVYAEIDDEQGRVAGAALDVKALPNVSSPGAALAIPPLAPGPHWIVVSGEPRGAEHLGGATLAKPLLVGTAAELATKSDCDVGPMFVRHPAEAFPRWVAVDGLPERSASNRHKHRLGMFIGLLSLAAAAILETLLLVAASREARVAMQMAELEEGEDAAKVTAKPPGGGLAIALLVAIMGFALLAVLIVAKG